MSEFTDTGSTSPSLHMSVDNSTERLPPDITEGFDQILDEHIAFFRHVFLLYSEVDHKSVFLFCFYKQSGKLCDARFLPDDFQICVKGFRWDQRDAAVGEPQRWPVQAVPVGFPAAEGMQARLDVVI